MQNYQKNLINFRYVPNLYKDRYSDADFTAEKLVKSSLICPWISIDLLWVNPFKIWTKAIEKFLRGCCLLVVKGWLSWKEATKMGQNTQNNVEYTRKYSVISNTSDLYCSSPAEARHFMLWHNWDNNILTDVTRYLHNFRQSLSGHFTMKYFVMSHTK